MCFLLPLGTSRSRRSVDRIGRDVQTLPFPLIISFGSFWIWIWQKIAARSTYGDRLDHVRAREEAFVCNWIIAATWSTTGTWSIWSFHKWSSVEKCKNGTRKPRFHFALFFFAFPSKKTQTIRMFAWRTLENLPYTYRFYI